MTEDLTSPEFENRTYTPQKALDCLLAHLSNSNVEEMFRREHLDYQESILDDKTTLISTDEEGVVHTLTVYISHDTERVVTITSGLIHHEYTFEPGAKGMLRKVMRIDGYGTDDATYRFIDFGSYEGFSRVTVSASEHDLTNPLHFIYNPQTLEIDQTESDLPNSIPQECVF